jgi:hypothetical protein
MEKETDMTDLKDVRFEFDIAVIDGSLDQQGGVTVPFELIAALHAEASNHQVDDLAAQDATGELQQAQLFADKIVEIWNALGTATAGWKLSDTFEPTGGSRPPWRNGSGAMYSLLEVSPTDSSTNELLRFDNAPATPLQQVTVKFLLSLQFV